MFVVYSCGQFLLLHFSSMYHSDSFKWLSGSSCWYEVAVSDVRPHSPVKGEDFEKGPVSHV